MPTFEKLRKIVLKKAGVENQFQLSPAQKEFWSEINSLEFQRGYSEEYGKPGSLGLFEMDLLTKDELREWVRRFKNLK